MSCNRIVLSSGHGLFVRGACGILDEVDEARLVVEQLADDLKNRGVDVVVFHDDVSRSQNENLNRIVDFHNGQVRDLDVSIHFNAYEQVSKPMGTEVLYVTQKALAAQVSAAIASTGFINRGAKYRDDLFFLNNTAAPAILIEVCFVDSEADAELYHKQFNAIIEEIANTLAGTDEAFWPDPVPPPVSDYLFEATGKCSYFGGEDDLGVSDSEGLAFHYAITEANQHLFVPLQPAGTSGLARRLNAKAVPYVACRWDYNITPKKMLAESGEMALVTNVSTGRSTAAFPADWGPHEEKTGGRVADLSPALMRDLDLETDDVVEVVYPWRGD